MMVCLGFIMSKVCLSKVGYGIRNVLFLQLTAYTIPNDDFKIQLKSSITSANIILIVTTRKGKYQLLKVPNILS